MKLPRKSTSTRIVGYKDDLGAGNIKCANEQEIKFQESSALSTGVNLC